MPSCVVKWCRSHTDMKNTKITFHKFPTNEILKEKWTAAVRLERNEPDWTSCKYSKICSMHFQSEALYKLKNGSRIRLKKLALPICTMVGIACQVDDACDDQSGESFNANDTEMQEEPLIPPHEIKSEVDIEENTLEPSCNSLMEIQCEMEVPLIAPHEIKSEVCREENTSKPNHSSGTKVLCEAEESLIPPHEINNEIYIKEHSIEPSCSGTTEIKSEKEEYTIVVTEDTNPERSNSNTHESILKHYLEKPTPKTVEENHPVYLIASPICNYNYNTPTVMLVNQGSYQPPAVVPPCSTPLSTPHSAVTKPDESTPTERELQKKLTKKTELLRKRLFKIKNLQRQTKRLKAKNLALKEIIKEMKRNVNK